jgi:hypothetical protein
MTEPRDVTKIVVKLLEIIPESESKLIWDLNYHVRSSWNIAPEEMFTSRQWMPVGQILTNNIRELDEEWKVKVHKIFMGEE